MDKLTDIIIRAFSQMPPLVQLGSLLALIAVLVWLIFRRYKLKLDLRQARVDVKGKERQIEWLKGRVTEGADLAQSLREQVSDLEGDVAQLQERLTQTSKELGDVKAQLGDAINERQTLEARFDSLQDLDIGVWLKDCSGPDSLPAFVPAHDRRTRFVSFLNHKGGVGKTTLVANLGGAFATGATGEQLSVLLVDLDNQGTLSNNCVATRDLEYRRENKFSSTGLIDGECLVAEELLPKLMANVEGTEGRAKIIIAREHLYEVDFRQQACFAVAEAEVRFFHRQLLHDGFVFDRFDLVLFDCPPRLTASSINALMASDFVVIPTGLKANDVEAVPRGLRWLEKLRTMQQFRARLAGVIANETFHTDGTLDGLTAEEGRLLDRLNVSIRRYEPGGNAVLRHTVRRSTDIRQAAEGSQPLGVTDKGHALFDGVARELYERIAP